MNTVKKLNKSELESVVGGNIFTDIGNAFKSVGQAIGDVAVAGADEISGDSSGASQAIDQAGEDALDSVTEVISVGQEVGETIVEL